MHGLKYRLLRHNYVIEVTPPIFLEQRQQSYDGGRGGGGGGHHDQSANEMISYY